MGFIGYDELIQQSLKVTDFLGLLEIFILSRLSSREEFRVKTGLALARSAISPNKMAFLFD